MCSGKRRTKLKRLSGTQGSVAEVEIEGPHQLSNLSGEKRGDKAELKVKRILTNLINCL